MTDRACSTCIFSLRHESNKRIVCRASPPDAEHGWPLLWESDTCGGYKPQTPKDAPVRACSTCKWFDADHCEKFPPQPTLWQNTRLRHVYGDEYECGDIATAWGWFPREPSDTCKQWEQCNE